jgi:hypothetical protein
VQRRTTRRRPRGFLHEGGLPAQVYILLAFGRLVFALLLVIPLLDGLEQPRMPHAARLVL